MKIVRRLLAAIALLAVAFQAVGSFLSWAQRQDDAPADAWIDEEDEFENDELNNVTLPSNANIEFPFYAHTATVEMNSASKQITPTPFVVILNFSSFFTFND